VKNENRKSHQGKNAEKNRDKKIEVGSSASLIGPLKTLGKKRGWGSSTAKEPQGTHGLNASG